MFKLRKIKTLEISSLHIVNSRKKRNSLIEPLLNSATCHTHSSFENNYRMCTKVYGLHGIFKNSELYHMYLVSETEWLSLFSIRQRNEMLTHKWFSLEIYFM